MKKIILLTLAMVFMASLVFGASIPLKASWTPNSEPDMASYKLYRTDGTRTLLGTIAHPTVTYSFSVTVADNSQGTLTFVLTAVDTAGNESLDSGVATYPFDLKAPVAPGGLGVVKQ
jgi:hypothetical protein